MVAIFLTQMIFELVYLPKHTKRFWVRLSQRVMEMEEYFTFPISPEM